jgi:hypothetical protein
MLALVKTQHVWTQKPLGKWVFILDKNNWKQCVECDLCIELAVVCLEVQLNTMSSFMLVPSKYKVERVTANCVQLQLRQLEKAVVALVLADDTHWCHWSKAQVSHCLQITSSTAWVAA